MKKTLLLLLSFVFTLAAYAGQVSRSQALQKAKQFMPGRQLKAVEGGFTRGESVESQAFYVFNVTGGGFVIVSGDDRTESILGYSETGMIDLGNLPDNLRCWLDNYQQQIEGLADDYQPATKARRRAADEAISPLIKTRWNQYAPYNLQCPVYNSNVCVTGCVATALAQVMYYYKYPVTSTEIPAYDTRSLKIHREALPATTFKWDKMNTEYSGSETGESADAVAELMQYVGQAMQMDYAPGGSSAAIDAKAMISYFGYSTKMHRIWRSEYSVAQWEELILNELKKGQPVLYDGSSYNQSGDNTNGHQFICDGYDGSGLFHINWGWGGGSDGYFILSLANPADRGAGGGSGTGGYAMNQSAFVDFVPADNNEKEVPRFNAGIYGDMLKNTYSRSAVGQAFENVLLPGYLTYEYAVAQSIGYDYDYGWGLYKDGKLQEVLVYETGKTQTNVTWHYLNSIKTVSFGASLADGDYQLYLIYKPSDTTEWLVGSNSGCLTATVSGTSLTLKANSQEEHYVVNKISYSGAMEDGGLVDMTVNLTNDGQTMQETVCVWIGKGASWQRVALTTGSVEPGKTGDVKLSFVFPLSGNLTVKITSDMEGTKEVFTESILVAEVIEATIGDLSYRLNTQLYTAAVVPGNYGSLTSVTIPSAVTYSGKSYKVNAIADGAFERCYSLVSLTIEPGLETIGESTFWNCYSLTSAILPEGVKTIGSQAFRYCYGLQEVSLPSTLESIGDNAFGSNQRIATVKVYMKEPVKISRNVFAIDDDTFSPATLYVPQGSGATYKADPVWNLFPTIYQGEIKEAEVGGIWYRCITGEGIATLIAGDYSEITALTVPSTITVDGQQYAVKSIDEQAFFQSGKLSSLTIEPGLETIGKSAFWNVNGLKTVVIPEGVKAIGERAFRYCYGLNEVSLPSTLERIGDNAFGNCERVNTVTIYMFRPFDIADNVFGSTSNGVTSAPTATLYVPYGKSGLYKNTEGWKQFANIQELEQGAGVPLKGDANGDGVVNAADLVLMISYIRNGAAEGFVFEAADTNGDQTVDKADIQAVVDIIMKGK